MNSTLVIAKRDFLAQINSLKGSIIFWFFLIFMGFFFHSFVYAYVDFQSKSMSYNGDGPNLNQLLTAIFHNLHFILLLLVPSVTMSCISEEKKNYSIRLLRTAPVTSLNIVLGKYLGCMVILSLALLASSVYPMYTLIFGNADANIVLSSYLGVFLLMGAQVSLGLWVSTNTSNQFIAFVFTMFGLFLLLILNWVAPNITGSGEIEQVVKYLASTSHLDNFFKGLITISDLMYFVVFISTFLFLSHVSLESQRWR